jgi:hypothetical protein
VRRSGQLHKKINQNNYEVQYPVNLMLEDEITKKKDKKNHQSQQNKLMTREARPRKPHKTHIETNYTT